MRALGKGSIASIIKVGLDIVWVLLWVAAGFLALGLVAYVAALWLMQTGLLPHGLVEPGPRTAHFGPLSVQINADSSFDWRLMASGFLAGAVAIGGALIIVLRLKRLFKNFTSGAPFSRDNANHLRIIWITMLAMELSKFLIAGLIASVVFASGHLNGASFDLNHGENTGINLSTWFAILILIVLAEVFREGARLKEEQELTI